MTHMLIGAIVYGKNEQRAMKKAKSVFEYLLKCEIFDYYTTFDEDAVMSGKNRWGKYPPIVRVDSNEGKTLINSLWNYTKDKFLSRAQKLRYIFDLFTNEEIFNEECKDETKLIALSLKLRDFKETLRNLTLARYYMLHMGGYRGEGIYLYNDEAEGIQTKKDLDAVLNKYRCIYEDNGKENPHKDDFIWVIPADAHY